ncbi:glycosyltransferase [Tianweitania sp. BSSL-BM11]|uniref:Glycosyltransferase n=1 Tax=Tianweitania aestuarii TaxID=2814886 RepID=A0ABS5RWV2_9HYPH|nr:glycosyltransferase [Tianweitania aestuarii]MBS9720766.1 glycosyltransferase [Tianweitania aestuarii]
MTDGLDEFDAQWYVRAYPDVNGSGLSPQKHYQTIGKALGRSGFDSNDRPITKPSRADDVTVSIICVTFNHEYFIRECLDSILSQKVDFNFEVIVADDCSSDSTADIVAEYAARDRRINFIRREQNIGPGRNFADAAERAKGEFLAICEGDDYWTDIHKLQLQLDYMRANPVCSLCFHPVKVVFDDGSFEPKLHPPEDWKDFSLRALIHKNFIQTNSVMYRWRYTDGLPEDYNPDIVPGDWHMHLLHAEIGEIGFIDRVMSVYRRHAAGMWATSDGAFNHHRKYIRGELFFFTDLSEQFGGFYRDVFIKNAVNAFTDYAEGMLDRRLYEELAAVARDFPSLARRTFAAMGFKGEFDFSSAESLKHSIFGSCAVDVIVLTYNHGSSLEQCLRSVLNQTCDFPFSIIIGDDNSQDDTSRIVSGFVSTEPDRITYLSSGRNDGMLKNLSRCVEESSAPFIAFCEGDDYWLSPFKLQQQVLQLLRNPRAGMTFNRLLLEHVEFGRFEPHEGQTDIEGSKVSFNDIYQNYITANFSCCLYRREAVEAVPAIFYEIPGAADWLFNLFVADKFDVLFDANIMSVYRIHEKGSWSGLSLQERMRRIRQAQQTMRSLFGPARGVGGSRLKIDVNDIASSEDMADFSAFLDLPFNGKPQYVEQGAVKIEGWCVHLYGKQVLGHLKTKDGISSFPLDYSRLDVTQMFEESGETAYRDHLCGFDIRLPFAEVSMSFELGFSTGGDITWWKNVIATIEDPELDRKLNND